jgi:hypothetical protein
MPPELPEPVMDKLQVPIRSTFVPHLFAYESFEIRNEPCFHSVLVCSYQACQDRLRLRLRASTGKS